MEASGLRDAGNFKAEVTIVSGPHQSKELDGIPDKTFGGQYYGSEILIPSGVFPEFLDESTDLFEQKRGLTKGSLKKKHSKLERILFHESLHNYHLVDGGYQAMVNDFLSLRAEGLRRKFEFDRDLRDALNALNTIRMDLNLKKEKVKSLPGTIQYLLQNKNEIGAPINSDKAQRQLKLKKAELERLQMEIPEMEKRYEQADRVLYEMRVTKYKELGLPSRFDGDQHGAEIFSSFGFKDPLGAEYFAMAVEMMVYDHAGFCATFSPEEIKFLKVHLGGCLSGFNVAQCR